MHKKSIFIIALVIVVVAALLIVANRATTVKVKGVRIPVPPHWQYSEALVEPLKSTFDAVLLYTKAEGLTTPEGVTSFEQNIVNGTGPAAALLRDRAIKVSVFDGERDPTDVLKDRVGALAFATMEPHTVMVGRFARTATRVIVATHSAEKDPTKYGGGREDFYVVHHRGKTILLEYATTTMDGLSEFDAAIRTIITHL